MIFEAKRQSFTIFSMLFILVGSMLITDCKAERTPISLESQSRCHDLIGADDFRQHEVAKLDRQRNEKSWSEFKLFANVQASAAKQKIADLDLGKWWHQASGNDASSAVQPRSVECSQVEAIGPTAWLVKLTFNMTATQWCQASNLSAGLVESGKRQVAQASSKVEARMRASLIQLVESASGNAFQLANDPRISGIIQVITVACTPDSNGADLPSADELTISVNEDLPADPYWQYYSDCDFWGAEFEVTKE